jgi:hypothetical protein
LAGCSGDDPQNQTKAPRALAFQRTPGNAEPLRAHSRYNRMVSDSKRALSRAGEPSAANGAAQAGAKELARSTAIQQGADCPAPKSSVQV